MIWVIIFCSVVMVALDYKVTQRLFGPKIEGQARAYLAGMWIVDTMPLIYAIVGLCLRDNSTMQVMISMWIYWGYMVVAIARQPLGIAILLSQSRVVRGLGAIVWCAVATIFFYGMAFTRTDYTIKEIEIASERLPKSFDGYRVLYISDLHLGTMVSPEKELAEIIRICNSQQADVVAFSGDLINIRHEEITPHIEQLLGSLKARDGVYAVTGNHDIGVYIKDSITFTPESNAQQLIEKQQRCGWRVLMDQTEYIGRGADSIALTGISFTKAQQEHRHSSKAAKGDIDKAYKGVPSGIFNITLSHIPQLWDDIIAKQRADLTLAGHTHAMQLRLPIGERGVSPSRILYKRWSGLYEEQGRWLYINDGIGCIMYPMRLGVPPEITLITLRSR